MDATDAPNDAVGLLEPAGIAVTEPAMCIIAGLRNVVAAAGAIRVAAFACAARCAASPLGWPMVNGVP